MGIQLKTSSGNVAEKHSGFYEKIKKRWSIKSGLATFLAAVITITTVHSQVLYVQAENEIPTDNRRGFTFASPVLEKTEYQLGSKGTLEETLEQLPKMLPIILSVADAGSDQKQTDSVEQDVAGEGSAESTEQDVTESTSVQNTEQNVIEGAFIEGTEQNVIEGASVEGTEQDVTESTSVESTGQDAAEPASVENAGQDAAEGVSVESAEQNVTEPAPVENTEQDVTKDNTPELFDMPVIWDCENYSEIRDSYIFTATWDEGAYNYTGAQEDIPKITVKFEQIPGIRRVSTQEELRGAFSAVSSAGESSINIVLFNDIALTETLYISDLPENVSVTLESNIGENGTVFSLKREADASGNPFTGPMLVIGGYDMAENAVDAVMSLAADNAAGASLTLRNIIIDGKMSDEPTANVSAAPAIINNGHLILETGARVINNYNGGTYRLDSDGVTRVLDENGKPLFFIPPYGGGIWAHKGTLELKNGCLIQGNTAFWGGGIYLDGGAVLRYNTEAEALTGNTAAEGGIGADLYAGAGSILYYDSADFIKWNTFYIDPAAVLIPENGASDTTTPVEIYLNVVEDSGYSFREVKDKLESAFGGRVTVLLPQTYIDTTDLRNWYVYDHYDANCWEQIDANGNGIPDGWEQAYKEYLHRPYYAYYPTHTKNLSASDIPTWLEKVNKTPGASSLYLDPFKEHIYSRTENGRPEMTFAGYDVSPIVDFLFYNPQSNGEKVVNFDVDSTKVNTHTLAGTGFLVNTGISTGASGEQLLSGYLIYYTYGSGTTGGTNNAGGTVATAISLYQFNNVDIYSLHNNGIGALISGSAGTKQINKWENEMSIEITVSPEKVTVTQKPKGSGDDTSEKFEWSIDDTGYSGFGPLVAYGSHSCRLASSFTYSDLHMKFTNADREKSLLSPLMEADFSQGTVKRYYLNLLGKSGVSYSDDTGTQMGQYNEYLYLMQKEGIGLITDANTPFEEYLGKNSSKNLFEISSLKGKADLNALVTSIRSYLPMHSSTIIGDLQAENLKEPVVTKSVGNICLTGINGEQLARTLNANKLPPRYVVNVVDIACRISGNEEASYALLKPGSSDYLPLPFGSESGGGEETAAYFSVPGGSTGPSFVITNDPVEWPAGEYVVRQEIEGSAIYGYSYFTLTRPTFVETEPEVVPSTEGSVSPAGESGDSLERPEIVPDTMEQQAVLFNDSSEPKTGDGMFPAMPVACGACTAFMLKIMLWMYDMDFDAVTICKEDTVRTIILWGKGSGKPRIYLAIVALTAVITVYHLLKAFYENSKQIVRERFGRA